MGKLPNQNFSRKSHECKQKIVSEEKNDEEILLLAKQLMWRLDLLIKQCDSWLPEEEGRRNFEKKFREREKARRRERWEKIKNWIKRMCRLPCTALPIVITVTRQ